MKIKCTVTKVSDQNETMTITLLGRQSQDAEWRRNQDQEITVTANDKMRKAFYLGREVTITVEPK